LMHRLDRHAVLKGSFGRRGRCLICLGRHVLDFLTDDAG
jgi:hypothetical protein